MAKKKKMHTYYKIDNISKLFKISYKLCQNERKVGYKILTCEIAIIFLLCVFIFVITKIYSI